MKESLRRIILFAVTVVTGSVMILFDVPPVVMVPLLIVVGFIILLGLGAITVADMRDIAGSLKPANLRKISILQRLDEMKFFEKAPKAPAGTQNSQKPEKTAAGKATAAKPEKKTPAKDAGEKPGIMAHLGTFFSSLGSLGTVLKERTKQGKKVEDINKLLDKTINEKVSGSALASAGNVTGEARPPVPGGAGSGAAPITEQDPFLSLSGDEFDTGLLDGLDEMDAGVPGGSGTGEKPGDTSRPDSMPGESAMPAPSMDLSQEADEILKGNATGLGEFSGLEGGDTIDEDFGDLGDLSLDDVNMDDVSLDEEFEEGTGQKPPATAEIPAEITPAGPSGPAVTEVKTDWVKSDAPQGGEDQVSTHADMAAFAGGGGTDEDLLSSIASDVKHVKKEKDISLLRDLKDFKAPAEEIEQELTQVYDRINAIPKPGKISAEPPAKEIK